MKTVVFFLKMLFYLIVFFLIGLAMHKAYQFVVRYRQLQVDVQQFQKLNERAAILEKRYVTERELRKQVEEKFRKEKAYLLKKIHSLTSTTVKVEGAENTIKVDPNNPNEQHVEAHLTGGPPLCGAWFNQATQELRAKIYDFKILIDSVLTYDPDARTHSVLTTAYLQPLNPPPGSLWEKAPYPLGIYDGKVSVNVQEKELETRFYWFLPKFTAGFNVLNQSVLLGLSLMGMGTSRTDLDWLLVNLSWRLGETSFEPGFAFTPLLWRPLPSVLYNTYIGLGVNENLFFGVFVSF